MKNILHSCGTYKSFYFKVNNKKTEEVERFSLQVNKVIDRINNNYKIISNNIGIDKGVIDDDFIMDRFTLRIKVNCR